MADEIFDPLGIPDRTIYAVVFNPTGKVWNTSSEEFETYATANRADYDIPLTEQGTSSGIYIGSFPSAITASGTYQWVSYIQDGGTPSESDNRADSGEVDWTGSAAVGAGTGSMSGSDWRDYVLRGGFKRTDKDTELYEATTDAIQEMRRRFKFQEAEAEKTTTDTITVDGDYKLTIESDFGLLCGIVIEDDEDAWPLQQISKARFEHIYPDINVTNDRGIPNHFCLFNDQILIGPVPDKVTYNYRKSYSQRAGTVSSSTDAVPFTNLYREVLRDGVTARLYELMDQFDRAQFYYQKSESGFNQAMNREEFNTGEHTFIQMPEDSYWSG